MSQLKIKNGNNWESIPAGGIGVPSGGTTGQYLKKSSSDDYATEWSNLPAFQVDTLLSEATPAANATFTLSSSIENYDAILFDCGYSTTMKFPRFEVVTGSSMRVSCFMIGVITNNSVTQHCIYEVKIVNGVDVSIVNFNQNGWNMTKSLTIKGMKFN